MKWRVSSRTGMVLWLVGLLLWLSVCLLPISNLLTRTSGLVLLAMLWLGALALGWKWRGLRWALLGISACGAIFLVCPARTTGSPEALRADYLAALRRYDGCRYFWGGESVRGIDCSGLIRRGLVDAMFARGVRTLDPGLVRGAIALWWQDTTARVLGEAQDGQTFPLLETNSLQAFDHASLQPGDLAVTRQGIHILAYLGGKTWIQADPMEGKVVIDTLPSGRNWYHIPMRIVRWGVLR